jgi:hypothetical protein
MSLLQNSMNSVLQVSRYSGPAFQQLSGNPDDTSTVAMLTPSETRATSPALTERPTSLERNQNQQPTPIQTLRYIALIETSTYEAIFDLEPADINAETHKTLHTAKDICTQMVAKGYGGAVKLQDILDMAVKMAAKK